MAAPLRAVPRAQPQRPAPVRSHSGTTQAGRAAFDRPRLVVIRGRRRATRYFVTVMTILSFAMGGVIFLNTQLAMRQYSLDELDGQLKDEQQLFEELRAQRAELRSLDRLAPLAAAIGMESSSQSEFVTVDPWVYARQIALSGQVPGAETGDVSIPNDPMEQYRQVKELVEVAP